MRSRKVIALKKVLLNGYAWAIVASGFCIGSGLLMEHNGVKEFAYAGGRFNGGQQKQVGSPEMLYGAGGFILVLALLRALLVRMDEVKAFRAKNGDNLLPGK